MNMMNAHASSVKFWSLQISYICNFLLLAFFQMEEGNGDNLMGRANSSAGGVGDALGGLGGGGGALGAGGDLSYCSASPEETVQNFLEQVSSSYSSESSFLFAFVLTNPQSASKFHQKLSKSS